jgi:hypothetical protein
MIGTCGPYYSGGSATMSNIDSVHLETVLVLVQNRCTVCAKYT